MKLVLKWYTSIVHETMFSCILPFFKEIRSNFWPSKPSKLKKKFFLALILCFHYNLLQKTLRPLGSHDIKKNLPHTSYPYINITYAIGYGLLDIFQILDIQNVPVTQIIPCLAMLSKKMKVILLTLSKKTIIL